MSPAAAVCQVPLAILIEFVLPIAIIVRPCHDPDTPILLTARHSAEHSQRNGRGVVS